MKFLATGGLHGSRGPRLAITLCLLLLTLFLIGHGVRESLYWGFSPSRAASELTLPLQGHSWHSPPPGIVGAMEDLHVDLFLFAFVFLFAGATLQQLLLPPSVRRALLWLAGMTPALYLLARFLMHLFAPLAWAALIAAPALYGVYATLIVLILRLLWQKRGPSGATL